MPQWEKNVQGYDYARMTEEIFALCAREPMLRLFSAGRSVMGRELWCMEWGRGEKTVLFLGTHHAREYVTARLLVRMCEELCEACAPMRHTRAVFLPMLNPDGVEICLHGALNDEIAQMPRVNGTFSAWKANARGVDLNRNYPCLWEQKRVVMRKPASELYNGGAAASEPEVRAAMALARALSPALALTFHAKGEEIYWADSNTPALAEQSLRYAQMLARESGYRMLPPSEDPAIYAAGFENWFRAEFERPCILLEVGAFDGYEPFDLRRFDTEIWRKLQKIPQKMLFLVEN